MSYSIFAVILLGFELVVAAWCYLATYIGNCAGPNSSANTRSSAA